MTKEEMPRERAIEVLEYVKHTGNGESEYKNDAQAIAINMGIEAIKQMDAIDKIRAKIEAYQSDAFYHDNVMMNKEMVLGIIDKYKEGEKDG